eukprot:353975_1
MVLYTGYLLLVILFSLSTNVCDSATGANIVYLLALGLIQCVSATAFQSFLYGLSGGLSVIHVVSMLLIVVEVYLSLIQFDYLIGLICVVVYNVIYLLLFEFTIALVPWIVYCALLHLVLCYFKNYVLYKWFTSSRISRNVDRFGILTDNHASNAEYCTIVMGSCTDQKFNNLAVYQALHRELANIVLLLGDNIYADLSPPTSTKLRTKCCKTQRDFKEEYDLLLKHKDFRPDAYDYSNQVWLACWDDHDYGDNDACGDYSEKVPSKRAFIEFLEAIHSSQQVNEQIQSMKDDMDHRGTYYSYDYEQAELDLRMRIIMLDTRFDRATDDSDIVGNTQWEWLRQQVSGDTDRFDWYLICNGSPVLNEGGGGKKTVGQATRDGLFEILSENDGKLLNKTVLFAGDLHYGVWHSWNKQLYEFTSSSITHSKQWFCCKCQYKYLDIEQYTMAKEHNGNGATEKSPGHCCKNNFGILNINKKKFEFGFKDAFGYSYLNVTHEKKNK